MERKEKWREGLKKKKEESARRESSLMTLSQSSCPETQSGWGMV